MHKGTYLSQPELLAPTTTNVRPADQLPGSRVTSIGIIDRSTPGRRHPRFEGPLVDLVVLTNPTLTSVYSHFSTVDLLPF